MLFHCLKCRKNTENKNRKVVRIESGRIMLISKYALCDSKKLKFIKEQEASGLLSSLGIKTLLKNYFIRSFFVLGFFNKLIQDIK